MERYEDRSSVALVPVSERTVSFEGNAEFSLPEYLGEVGKLLWVRPTLRTPNGFLSAGTAEYAGRITYRVLYVGTDGKLYGTEQEESYSFSLPCEASGVDRISVLPEVDAVISRVLGPRKLSVRCRMRAEVTGYTEKNMSPEADSAGDLCPLGGVAEGGRFLVLQGDAVQLDGEMALEGGTAEVTFAHAEIYMPDVTVRAGEVHCRGEAVVTLVLSPEEGVPYATVRRLPFDTSFAGEVSSGAAVRAFGTVNDLRTACDGGTLSIAVSFVPVAEVQENVPVSYLRDAFLPGARTECRSERVRIFNAGECRNVHFSVSGTADADACGLPREATVLAALAEAEVRDRRCDERGTVVSGEICCHILYKNGEELGAAGASVPFSVRAEGGFEALSVKADVPVCRVGRQGDVLTLDAELLLALRACNTVELTRVSGIGIGESVKPCASDMEICYPARGETLWDVAKRYTVSPEELALANGVSCEFDALPEGTAYLVIPDLRM